MKRNNKLNKANTYRLSQEVLRNKLGWGLPHVAKPNK